MPTPKSAKSIGQFAKDDNWDAYWETSISEAAPQLLSIRGYHIQDVVRNLSYGEVLFLTIRGDLPDSAQRRVFEAALCSMPDHGLLSSQAGATRFVASGWPATIVPAMAAGILCIGEMTISPQETGELIRSALTAPTEDAAALETLAEGIVTNYLEEGRLLPGIGHPQHKTDDIRASALRRIAEEEGVWRAGGQFYDLVHQQVVAVKGRFLPMNIDGVLGCVLHDLGFEPLEMAGIAAVAVLPGIIAHAIEEVTHGVPLRVVQGGNYVGPGQRSLPTTREAKSTPHAGREAT